MFHLFQHSKGKLKGKYDFAFVKNGKYICGSNQGYERRLDALKSIRLIVDVWGVFQDDTLSKPMFYQFQLSSNRKVVLAESVVKPKKKYQP